MDQTMSKSEERLFLDHQTPKLSKRHQSKGETPPKDQKKVNDEKVKTKNSFIPRNKEQKKPTSIVVCH
jgi:hypothetical protein